MIRYSHTYKTERFLGSLVLVPALLGTFSGDGDVDPLLELGPTVPSAGIMQLGSLQRALSYPTFREA